MTIQTIIEQTKQEILEWNTYLPNVKAQSIDVLGDNLQSQLSTLLDEIEKQVETNKKPRLPENIYMGNYKDMSDAGYNQAIEEVLSILNKYR